MVRGTIALAIAVATPLLGGATPASADHTYKLLHFNMCGNVCHTGTDTTDDAGDPVEAIRRSLVSAEVDPIAASLNEVCFNQFEALMRVLPAGVARALRGRQDAVGRRRSLPSGRKCTPYGNALVTRRTIVDDSTEEVQLPHPKSETRKLLCFRVDLVQDTWFCTSHIAPLGTWDVGAHEKQDDQIATVTRHINGYVDNGRPTVVMGDFNVQPTSDKLDRVYHGPTFGGGASGRFKEVGQGDPNPDVPVHAAVPLRRVDLEGSRTTSPRNSTSPSPAAVTGESPVAWSQIP